MALPFPDPGALVTAPDDPFAAPADQPPTQGPPPDQGPLGTPPQGYGVPSGYGAQPPAYLAPQGYGVPPAYGTPPFYGAQPGYAAPPPGYGSPAGYPVSYGPPYQGAVAQRGTNGFAIASMVLGILWLYWVGSVLALVFGYIALKQIKQRGEGGKGMAIAGVVLGWVEVAVIPIIIIAVFAIGSSVKGDFRDTCDQFSQDGTSSPAACP
jgi:hypothetical protein